MQVRLLCARATADESQVRGQVLTLPDDEAQRMIADSLAAPVSLAPATQTLETAAVAPPETATRKRKYTRRTRK